MVRFSSDVDSSLFAFTSRLAVGPHILRVCTEGKSPYDRARPSGAEAKNAWRCSSILLVFAWRGVKWGKATTLPLSYSVSLLPSEV
jgi:hypothetical protein